MYLWEPVFITIKCDNFQEKSGDIFHNSQQEMVLLRVHAAELYQHWCFHTYD